LVTVLSDGREAAQGEGMFVEARAGAGQVAAEHPEQPEFVAAGVGDWGRFGLRSPRCPPQLHLQLRQQASFASVPSSSTPRASAGTKAVVEPLAEAQVMKPGPRKFVKLSKLMALLSSSEEDPLWEDSQSESDQSCRTLKPKMGRPRKV
jgi:hypothetical protein